MTDSVSGPGGPAPDLLLPCPFCGGGARVISRDDHDWEVSCSAGCYAFIVADSEAQAIAAWNRRWPSPAAPDRSLAELIVAEIVSRYTHAEPGPCAGCGAAAREIVAALARREATK